MKPILCLPKASTLSMALATAFLCLMLASCKGEGEGGAEAESGEVIRAKMTLRIPTTAAESGGGERVTGPVVFTSHADDSEAGGCTKNGSLEAGDFDPRRFGFDDEGQDVWAIDITSSCQVTVSADDATGTFGVTHGDYSATCEVDQSQRPLLVNFAKGSPGCATGVNNFP